MRRSAVQSNTQGSGSCRVCERSRATASVSSKSGQIHPTSLCGGAGVPGSTGLASATPSATKLGSENHCGADQPNCCA